MKRCFLLGILCLQGLVALAQEEEVLRAALYLSGASSLEEVPAEWVDRLEARHGRRIRVNDARIRPNDILSDYQIASLADYRATSGDILSWEELALVDGFGREAVAALRPFLSLESRRAPGAVDTVRVKATALLRTTLSSVGTKARLSGENWRLDGAWRGQDGTFHGEWNARWGRVVAGDYNLRFGQGLALWSGFSMSSLSTVDAFVRRSTGMAPVWSYTSASVHRGLACEYAGQRFQAGTFAALDGLIGIHAGYMWRKGQVGFTASSNLSGLAGNLSLSVDGRYNHRGRDWAFEAALRNRSWAGLAAFRTPMGEAWKLALQVRALPIRYSGRKYGEYAAAIGSSWKSGKWVSLAGKSGFGSSAPSSEFSFTVDAALLPIPESVPNRLQIRSYLDWQWQVSPSWALVLRLTERYRNYEAPRTALRADVKYVVGPWNSGFRAEGVHCEGWGLLTYLEGGYKGESLSSWLRVTAFLIDRWADRVYCYERDAAGTFSVPAYSGRGLSASAVAGYKLRFSRFTSNRLLSRLGLKANLRAAYTFRVGRIPAPTLNFQLQCDW